MHKLQIPIDFTGHRHPEEGKKLDRIPVAASEELKSFVTKMASMQRISTSELVHRYIVEGLKEDIVRLFIPEPHLDKSLREILDKFK